MKTNLEYRKGVLFVRLSGSLIKKTLNELENDLIPIILNAGIKYITFNFEKLNVIDNYGVELINNVYELIRKNKGRMSICNMNNKVKIKIDESDLKDKYYNSLNELRSLELFRL